MAPVVGASVAAATDAGYLVLVVRQGPPHNVLQVTVISLVILGAAVLAVLGSLLLAPRIGRPLLVTAAVVLLVLGVAGIFSIGIPLIVAGVLVVVGIARIGPDSTTSAG